MGKVKAFFTAKWNLGTRGAIVFLAAFSVGITLCMLALGARSIGELLNLMRRSYLLMPLLNLLPVLLLMLLLYFATANAGLAASLTGTIGLIMAVANRVKVATRGDPLLHRDLTLVGELLGIAKGLEASTVLLALLAAALLTGLTVALCVKVKTERLALRARVAGVLACTAVMTGCGFTLYRSTAIYDGLPVVGSFYNMANVHASKGNLYCFLYDLLVHRTQKPEGYDPQAVRRAVETLGGEAADVAAHPAERPHVIMIMGEAFSTLSDSGVLDFSGARDPLENFHRLGAEGIEGRLVVPARGGGTADTEFDVLTGRVSRYLRTAPYAYRLIASPTEALPTVLEKAGYHSFALHPGFKWFYNRQNVYRYLGFEEAVFEDSFPRDAYLDSFISEEATYDRLLAMIDGYLARHPGEPLFAFCLTIQNHYAYLNRYLPEGTYNFTSDYPFTDTERNNLSNYFHGTIDADEQLGRLAAYLEAMDEPAVIVYFGDHLPAMGEAVYDALVPGADAEDGSLDKETRLYRVPFLIWQNSAAQKGTGITARAEAAAMPDDMTISSNYFGAYVLELLGFNGLSPFFDYTNTVRADYPILLERLSFPRGGEPAGEDAQARLAFYQHWVYYRMMDE